jgi:hypothetical protein
MEWSGHESSDESWAMNLTISVLVNFAVEFERHAPQRRYKKMAGLAQSKTAPGLGRNVEVADEGLHTPMPANPSTTQVFAIAGGKSVGRC